MKRAHYSFLWIIILLLGVSGCSKPKITTFISFVPVESTHATPEKLSLAQTILQERLDTALNGVAEIHVENNGLQVGLSNPEDLNLAIELATNMGELVFFHSDISMEVGENIPPNATVIITDADIDTAKIRLDKYTQTWLVDIHLTSEGASKFAKYTQEHIGDYLIIAREGTVISAPYINSIITNGEATIFGEFDKPTAEVLAAQLNSGRLPFAFVNKAIR